MHSWIVHSPGTENIVAWCVKDTSYGLMQYLIPNNVHPIWTYLYKVGLQVMYSELLIVYIDRLLCCCLLCTFCCVSFVYTGVW